MHFSFFSQSDGPAQFDEGAVGGTYLDVARRARWHAQV